MTLPFLCLVVRVSPWAQGYWVVGRCLGRTFRVPPCRHRQKGEKGQGHGSTNDGSTTSDSFCPAMDYDCDSGRGGMYSRICFY